MAAKKKAAAKKAPAKKSAAPAKAKRFVRRPPTYRVIRPAEITEDDLKFLGADRVVHPQTGDFLGLNVPGQGRVGLGDVILVADDEHRSVLVCAQRTFDDEFVEAG